jgi:anti-sigma factor RsiW
MMTSLRGLGPPGDRDVFVDDNHRHAMWDAAYVLGSLSAADRREFEAHMADCPACRQAVAELSGIPAMLSQLDGNDVAAINESGHASGVPEMSPELLPSLLATVRWRRRRTRLVTWTASAAAAVVLTIGVLVGIQGSFPTSPPPQTTVSALPMAQVGTTLLASTVSLSSQQWGTHITLKFVCLAPPDAHHDTVALVVVGRDGSQTRLATWVAIPGHSAAPTGSISTPVNQIAEVQVVLADNGRVMLQRSI